MSVIGVPISELPLPGTRATNDEWARLYSALRPIVYSELVRVLPRPYVAAEDLWHELFARFVEEPQLLRSVLPEARETYVRIAVRRRAFDHLKRQRLRATASVQEALQEAAPSLDPSVRLDAEKLLALVDERDRPLVQMRYLEGFALGEIARRSHQSYASAAVRIFRALAKLRESLAKDQAL